MYVNYLKVSSALVLFSFASSEKIPQGFCFQEKVHVMEGPQTKLAIQFLLTLLLKCYFIFMFLLHADRHYMRLRIGRVLFSGGLTPISLEPLPFFTGTYEFHQTKKLSWVGLWLDAVVWRVCYPSLGIKTFCPKGLCTTL